MFLMVSFGCGSFEIHYLANKIGVGGQGSGCGGISTCARAERKT